MLAEQTDEVVLVAEAQGVGHFLHRLVGGEEQQLCPLHTDCLVLLHVAGSWAWLNDEDFDGRAVSMASTPTFAYCAV